MRNAEDRAMRLLRFPALVLCLLVPADSRLRGDEPAKNSEEKSRYEVRKEHDPDGIGKFYMGREIAQVMGHLGAEWLERPKREEEEAPSKLHEILKLKSGDVVADIGAGTGYHTF